MLLSICMMVKNEERHLEECLQSLQPLVRELGSEIIVVDTGSTDSTVEIAKRYTDKLYFHEWNNDFSGMRAVTISYAKGEWIFIIDGDEVLQDAAEIIDFFRSGLYKEYKTAMLEVKNFSKKDLSVYSILGSPRLFRAGTFHYEGAVHNQIIHEFPGLKLIATMLLHYGYIAEDKELMERKFERTSSLLKKELEKRPDSVYYRYQLSATYLMHGDVGKALEEGEKAYFMIKDDSDKIFRYLYILGHIAKIYIKLEKYEEMYETSEKGLKINQEYLDLWFYNFYYFFNRKDHDKIIEKGLKFIEVHENFKYLAMSRNSSVIMDTLDKIDLVRLFVARSFIEKNKYEDAVKQIMLINQGFEFKYEDIEMFVKACIKGSMFSKLIEYASRFLTNNTESMNFFIFSVEVNKKELLSDEKTELYRVFSKSEGDYSNLNKIRYNFYTGAPDIKSVLQQAQEYTDFNNSVDFYADIIYFMLKLGMPFNTFIEKTVEKNIEKFFQYIVNNYEDINELILRYLQGTEKNSSFYDIKLRKLLCETLLLNKKDFTEDEFDMVTSEYFSCGVAYIRNLYSPTIIENEYVQELKNNEEKFFLFLAKAYQNKENKFKEYAEQAVKHYPIMKNAIEYRLKKETQIKSSHDLSCGQRLPADELNLYKLISRADNLVMDGQYYDALNLYKQILSLTSLSNKQHSSNKNHSSNKQHSSDKTQPETFKESSLSLEIEKKISDLKSRYSNEIIFQKNNHGSSER